MSRTSSVDSVELNKFNKSHQEWWDVNGEFKILHEINPIRILYILEKIKESPSKNISILDVGCGGGLISAPLAKLGFNVTGLDANKHNIAAAIEYAKHNELKINFINSTVEKHAKKYDVILCLEVIEHVANPKEFIQNLTKLLNNNGIIILSTINRTMKSYFNSIIIAEYLLKWVKPGTHDYSKFIKPSELQHMLDGTNLEIKELKGLLFNPLSSWFLSDNVDVNYFAYICYTTSQLKRYT